MKQEHDIPNGWLTKRLSYLIKSMDAGVSVNSEDRQAEKGEFGILKTSAVTSGVFNADAAIPGQPSNPLKQGL